MIEPVLVAVEDTGQRTLINASLISEGYHVIEAENGTRALDLLQKRADIGLLMAEIALSDIQGVDFVTRIHTIAAHLPILVLVRSEHDARLAPVLDAGADDFLLMPPSTLRLKITLNGLFRQRNSQSDARQVRRYAEDHLKFKDLVAKSPKMRALIGEAKRHVQREVNILIIGEDGCEHDLFARIIHRENRTRVGSFARIQCQDFGNGTRLSTPRAQENWHAELTAKMNEVNHGSLLLADIDRLNMSLQQYLLELIKPACIGSRHDIRFMTTTTVDMQSLIDRGKFNADLLAVLEGARLEIAPLRERREDIEALSLIIMKVAVAETGRRRITGMGDRAIDLLKHYDWPGNVSELENTLFRAVLLSDGPILSVQDFPQIWHKRQLEKIGSNLHGSTLLSQKGGEVFWDEFGHVRPLATIEKYLIDSAMQRYGSRISEVARRLEISRATLYRKLDQYQIIAKMD